MLWAVGAINLRLVPVITGHHLHMQVESTNTFGIQLTCDVAEDPVLLGYDDGLGNDTQYQLFPRMPRGFLTCDERHIRQELRIRRP